MNTTPSQRLGFLHHIRLVPLFACILGGILVLFALSSALAGYFLWQADRDQRDVTAEIEIRTGLANSSDFLRSARISGGIKASTFDNDFCTFRFPRNIFSLFFGVNRDTFPINDK